MSKKLTSTVLLFAVFIGFLAWSLSMLIPNFTTPVHDGETIVYSILLLICSIAAGGAILMLPRKNS